MQILVNSYKNNQNLMKWNDKIKTEINRNKSVVEKKLIAINQTTILVVVNWLLRAPLNCFWMKFYLIWHLTAFTEICTSIRRILLTIRLNILYQFSEHKRRLLTYIINLCSISTSSIVCVIKQIVMHTLGSMGDRICYSWRRNFTNNSTEQVIMSSVAWWP